MLKRKRKYRKKSSLRLKASTLKSLLSIFLWVAAIFTLFSFFGQAADFGFAAQEHINRLFGWGAFLLPFLLADLGYILFDYQRNRYATWPFLLGLVLLMLSVITLAHLFLPVETAKTEATLGQGGGMIGFYLQLVLRRSISPLLTLLLLLGTFVAAILILFNTSLSVLVNHLGRLFNKCYTWVHLYFGSIFAPLLRMWKQREAPEALATEEPTTFTIGGTEALVENVPAAKPAPLFEELTPSFQPVIPGELPLSQREVRIETVTNPPFLEGVWEYPPMSLLQEETKTKPDQTRLNASAKIIESTLEKFGVLAKVVEVNLGPAITQYALKLNDGTKISKVTNLQSDLALALAAPGGTVRIEAPIPGKSLIGIEVPNPGLKLVPLKKMLTSKKMQEMKSVLAVALGEDVSGNPVITDLTKMPHVLIAGSTGSGKSVMINAMIAAILFRASPAEVKLILVDPKRVELSQYRGIPHLLTDVVVEPEKVLSALRWAMSEMEKRYKLFEKAGVRNIAGYNEALGFQSLPYIVIIIDELADIMMTAPREVESAICRISQLARATGIHLIVATQRPSVDVLTGLIKANVPCRIAFNVFSMVDSRVIIDGPGAEKLLGRGDMLYVPPDSSKPMRIQGVYMFDKEINALINFLRSSGFAPELKEEILTFVDQHHGIDAKSRDECFEEALLMVVAEGLASTSMLQRKLKIGYNRAANIMEALEIAGVVSPPDKAKKRNVLITDPQQVLGNQEDENEESRKYPSEGSGG